MPAGQEDLVIEQGAEFRNRWLVQGFDLTGYTAAMQIRKSVKESTTQFDLTTENGGITITPLIDSTPDSAVDIHITDDATAANVESSGVYDVKMIPPNGEDWFLVRGKVKYIAEVTR